MSYAEVIHDLAGEKDKQWLILRREAYEQAAKADAEIAALRAECAKLKQAGERAVGRLREHLTGNVSEPLEETITKLRDAAALRAECARKDAALERAGEMLDTLDADKDIRDQVNAALTPSNAGKRYAAMARVCQIMAEAEVTLHDDHIRVTQVDAEALLASLRELEK